MASGEASFDSKAPDRLRIGTCRTLLHWTIESIEGWTANKNKDLADLILISIFARSARTFEAIVRCLGERGFGEQGLSKPTSSTRRVLPRRPRDSTKPWLCSPYRGLQTDNTRAAKMSPIRTRCPLLIGRALRATQARTPANSSDATPAGQVCRGMEPESSVYPCKEKPTYPRNRRKGTTTTTISALIHQSQPPFCSAVFMFATCTANCIGTSAPDLRPKLLV
jgi:hypothetical protein